MKINFNYHSAGAWITLATAIVSGILGILTALGVTVPQDIGSSVTGVVVAIVSFLSAVGILTQDTDKKEDHK